MKGYIFTLKTSKGVTHYFIKTNNVRRTKENAKRILYYFVSRQPNGFLWNDKIMVNSLLKIYNEMYKCTLEIIDKNTLSIRTECGGKQVDTKSVVVLKD